MKWIISLFGIVAICVSAFFLKENTQQKNDDYVRIHIIANSNESKDQIVKYKVKDAVVDLLKDDLSKIKSVSNAKKYIGENLGSISLEVEKVLSENMCNYRCDVVLKKQLLPARAYTGLTLEEGEYETLVIKLGSGNGDNWWCVVFPDVCFAN